MDADRETEGFPGMAVGIPGGLSGPLAAGTRQIGRIQENCKDKAHIPVHILIPVHSGESASIPLSISVGGAMQGTLRADEKSICKIIRKIRTKVSLARMGVSGMVLCAPVDSPTGTTRRSKLQVSSDRRIL